MPRVRLKGVNTVRSKLADGRVATYYYHRATGIRLPDDPATPAFVAALAAAEATTTNRIEGTVSELIKGFCKSSAWDRLRESTRAIMRLNLNAVEARFGTLPIVALTDRKARPRFLEWRDEIAKTYPRAADAKLQAFSRVLSWAYDAGHIERNPIATFERVYTVDRSDMIWLPHHIEALTRVASIEIWQAMMLAIHTGQRQGDILRLTWSQYDGTALTLRQSKTKARVYIPCTRALKAMLDGMPRGDRLVIVTNGKGLPWTSDAFKKVWRGLTAAPVFEGLHFNDLRGTAVTMLSEASCTVQEVAAITGHSLESAQKILDTYLSRTRHMASNAIAKLDEHPRNNGLQNVCKTAGSESS